MCCKTYSNSRDASFENLKASFFALTAELDVSPHKRVGPHFFSLLHWSCHALRAIINFLCAVWDIATTPLAFCLSPIALPNLVLIPIYDLVATALSLVALALSPITFLARTIITFATGYGQADCCNSDSDNYRMSALTAHILG